ncbi:hypothetical protein OROHE_000098 [Orobanche hederae]
MTIFPAKSDTILDYSIYNADCRISYIVINHPVADFFMSILKSLALAYGQMILRSGFFHADPHPGNILICRGSEVALVDYGQVKDLPEKLRLGYAGLVLAIADNDPVKASESYRELGIDTFSTCENEELLRLAQTMFDTKLPPGVTMLQPFSDESSIKKIAVQAFPEELFSVLRTVHLLRGLGVGLGINYSCAEQWRPIAEEALFLAGRLTVISKDPLDVVVFSEEYLGGGTLAVTN